MFTVQSNVTYLLRMTEEDFIHHYRLIMNGCELNARYKMDICSVKKDFCSILKEFLLDKIRLCAQ